MVRDRRDPARTRALVGMGYPQGVEGDDEAMKRRLWEKAYKMTRGIRREAERHLCLLVRERGRQSPSRDRKSMAKVAELYEKMVKLVEETREKAENELSKNPQAPDWKEATK